jgi:hypothetical protein
LPDGITVIIILACHFSPHGGGYHVRSYRTGGERTVKWYNKVLRQVLIRHRLFEKLDSLQNNHHLMSADAFQLLFNRWDMEVTQLMLALEKW